MAHTAPLAKCRLAALRRWHFSHDAESIVAPQHATPISTMPDIRLSFACRFSLPCAEPALTLREDVDASSGFLHLPRHSNASQPHLYADDAGRSGWSACCDSRFYRASRRRSAPIGHITPRIADAASSRPDAAMAPTPRQPYDDNTLRRSRR